MTDIFIIDNHIKKKSTFIFTGEIHSYICTEGKQLSKTKGLKVNQLSNRNLGTVTLWKGIL